MKTDPNIVKNIWEDQVEVYVTYSQFAPNVPICKSKNTEIPSEPILVIKGWKQCKYPTTEEYLHMVRAVHFIAEVIVTIVLQSFKSQLVAKNKIGKKRMCSRSRAIHRDDATMSFFVLVTGETITQHLWLKAYIADIMNELNVHFSNQNVK